jgi:hypothetical protein
MKQPRVLAEPLLSPQENYNLQRTNYIEANKAEKIAEFNAGVRNSTGKFAKDYMYPAVKTIASINPITGVAVGFLDDKDAYSKGLYGASLLGVGLEALPCGGKYVINITRKRNLGVYKSKNKILTCLNLK